MPSFSIRNFGCRVNQAESFAWTEAIREGGLRYEADPSRSDLVVVNSCTLTGRADRDVRKFIRKIARENPAAGLVVTGCLAEREGEEIGRMPRVLLVLPNKEKARLSERVLALAGTPGPDADPGPAAGGPADGFFRSRALLKVQDGCDDGCTFCVIPSVRGRSSSVSQKEVLARVRDLVRQGFREIVLAGIHLSSYGRDREPRETLLGLLRAIEGVEGLGRVRLSSLDPRRTDETLAAHISGNPKICQHFHLSLQHASERVLEEMGRAVGPDVYRSVLSALRQRSPEASLGADIIVGFPGETEADFALLENFLRQSPLTYFHVFSYSPRPGTPAAARPRVSDAVTKRRSLALRSLSAEKNSRFRASFLGREMEAVVVRKKAGSDPKPGAWNSGFAELLTGNNIRVVVPSCPAPRRDIVRVRITRVLPHLAEGEVLPS
jgi:threonylcarbamoyladenosine tRNA methylthiotransferase MtaB